MNYKKNIKTLIWGLSAFLWFLSSAGLANSQAESNCTLPKQNDCSFYLECVEKKFQCGFSGYPQSYGYRYCQKFNNFIGFSDIGNKWVTATMLCLQTRLLPFLADGYVAPTNGCEILEKWSFDSHASCYTEHKHSFCFLGPKDIISAARVVGLRGLFGSKNSRQQVRQVLGICLKKLAGRKELKSQRLLIEDLYRRY